MEELVMNPGGWKEINKGATLLLKFYLPWGYFPLYIPNSLHLEYPNFSNMQKSCSFKYDTHPPHASSLFTVSVPRAHSYRQTHNRIHNIIIILLQRLDRLPLTNIRLRHHQLNILLLHPLRVHRRAVILFFLLLRLTIDARTASRGFALAVGGGGVVLRGGLFGGGELLGGGGLGLGVEVFDFGFAEDDPCLWEWLLARFEEGQVRTRSQAWRGG